MHTIVLQLFEPSAQTVRALVQVELAGLPLVGYPICPLPSVHQFPPAIQLCTVLYCLLPWEGCMGWGAGEMECEGSVHDFVLS